MDFEQTLAFLAVLTLPSLRAVTFVRPVSVDTNSSIVTRLIDTFVDVLKKDKIQRTMTDRLHLQLIRQPITYPVSHILIVYACTIIVYKYTCMYRACTYNCSIIVIRVLNIKESLRMQVQSPHVQVNRYIFHYQYF